MSAAGRDLVSDEPVAGWRCRGTRMAAAPGAGPGPALSPGSGLGLDPSEPGLTGLANGPEKSLVETLMGPFLGNLG